MYNCTPYLPSYDDLTAKLKKNNFVVFAILLDLKLQMKLWDASNKNYCDIENLTLMRKRMV